MSLLLAGRYNPGEILTGPEKAAKRLFHAQLAAGQEPLFIEYIGRGEPSGLLRKIFGEATAPILPGVIIQRKGIIPLLRLLGSVRSGVVHLLHFDRFAVLYPWFRRAEGLRLVYTVHGIVRHEETRIPRPISRSLRMKDRLAERILFRSADRIVFVSERAREIASEYYALPPERCSVIPNGIDPAFSVSGGRIRAGGEPLRIVLHGSPGRPEIRFGFLAEALARASAPVDLFLVHDDGRQRVPTLPERVRLSEHPRMTSLALARFYADKDVICSLKTYDTFSIAAAEAMASGLIPIVTRETGISDLIRHGSDGFVLDPSDVAGLAGVIDRLHSGPGAAAEISGHARRTAAALTWENAAASYREIYGQLLRGEG